MEVEPITTEEKNVPSPYDIQLMEACSQGQLDQVESLLNQGADVFYTDSSGRMPLHLAASSGNPHIVNLLLENGAPWNAQDKQGKTTGEYALRNNHPVIYTLLIDAGCRAELILGYAMRNEPSSAPTDYLQQKLVYSGDTLLDANGDGVMMGWEAPLMVKHAEMVAKKGGHILNIGYGLGLIDFEIQKWKPESHTIVEAHPDVYAHMIQKGWDKQPGVTLIFGRWQDVIDELVEQREQQFDGIFFDTFGEFYEDLRQFHEELSSLLKPEGGVYSFFNGLGATNVFFHDVYCVVAKLELEGMGFDVEYETVSLEGVVRNWEGVKGKYFTLDTYKYPRVTWKH